VDAAVTWKLVASATLLPLGASQRCGQLETGEATTTTTTTETTTCKRGMARREQGKKPSFVPAIFA